MKKTNSQLQINKTKIGNTNLEYAYREGGSKNILLLHGLNIDWQLWQNVIPEISPEFTCYAPSLPKYGRFRLRQYIKIVENFIKEKGLEKAYLVGHSLGGIIALKLIHRGIFFQKIILVNVPLFSQPPQTTKRAFNYWKKRLETDPIIKKTFLLFPQRIKRFRKIFERAPLESYLEGFADVLDHSLEPDMAKFNHKIPLMIVDGHFDLLLWACRGKALYRQLQPEAIIKLYTHHFIPRTHPKKLARIINNFFNKH